MTRSPAREYPTSRPGAPSFWQQLPTPALLITLGIVLRLIPYAANPSLAHDEATQALGILGQSYHELSESFASIEPAGIGFLYLQKAATHLLGPSEYALRLLPLLAAALAVPLYWLPARRITGQDARRPALWGLALMSLALPLISSAAEAGPAAIDVGLSLLVVHLALRVLDRTSWGGPGHGGGADALAIAGGFAIWCSPLCNCLLPAIVAVLLLTALRRGNARNTIIGAGVGCFWLLNFAAHHYLMALRAAVLDPASSGQLDSLPLFLPHFSYEHLTAMPHAAFAALRAITGGATFPWPVTVAGVLLAGALACLGLVHLWRANQRAFWLLLIAILAIVLVPCLTGAGGKEGHARMAAPLLALLIAAGLQFLGTLRSTRRLALIGGTLVLLPALAAAAITIVPRSHDEIRPLVAHIAAQKTNADVVYLLGDSAPAFRYYMMYRPAFSVRPLVIAVGPSDLDTKAYRAGRINEAAILRDITAPLREEMSTRHPPQVPKVWIVFAGTAHHDYAGQETKVVAGLDAMGKRRDEIHQVGTAAYLYELP